MNIVQETFDRQDSRVKYVSHAVDKPSNMLVITYKVIGYADPDYLPKACESLDGSTIAEAAEYLGKHAY